MPICEKDRSFGERYNSKNDEEKKTLIKANLDEILDPANQEMIERKWEYVKSYKFKMVGRLVYRKKELIYWQTWHEIVKRAKDIVDEDRMDKVEREAILKERHFKKNLEELATRREKAEEEVGISEIWAEHENKWRDKGKEDGKKARTGVLNGLERQKLETFQQYERRKRKIESVQDKDEKERQLCELEDWKEAELQKIEKEEGKYKG